MQGHTELQTPKLPAANQESKDTNLLELMGVIWRGKIRIAFIAFLAMCLGGYYAFIKAEPIFEATTTIALQLRNTQLVNIQEVLSGVTAEKAAMNTEIEVLKSAGLLQKLIADLDLISDPEFNSSLRPEDGLTIGKAISWSVGMVRTGLVSVGVMEPKNPDAPRNPLDTLTDEELDLNKTVRAVRDVIFARNYKDTYVFAISVQSVDPHKAALISNRLAELYIQDQIDTKFLATENAVTWLSERVVELEIELDEKENTVKDMRTRLDLTTTLALEVRIQTVRETRERIEETTRNIQVQQAKLDRLIELQATGVREDIAIFLDDPILKRLLEQGQSGSTQAFSTFDANVEKQREQLNRNITRAKTQAEALSTSMTRLEAEIEEQSKQLIALQQLERDTASTRTLYDSFLTRLKETSVQRGLQQADSRILSRATPGRFVSPRKLPILLVSMIMGGLIGVGWVMLRYFVQYGFRTDEELETYTGVKVLGKIPRMPFRRRRHLIKYLNEKPTSPAAESVRNLRTSLLLSNPENPPQVFMSTSGMPGEGKTTLSISLAHNLAALKKKTILIETDIRRRTLSEYFEGNENAPSFMDLIEGKHELSDVVYRDKRVGFDVLMGQESKRNAADVFASREFGDFIQMLRDNYDYVILDTPPVLIVPDGRLIGQYVDSIVINVAWDKTSRAQVKETLRSFAAVNLRVNALVMSLFNPKGMKQYGHQDFTSLGAGYYEK